MLVFLLRLSYDIVRYDKQFLGKQIFPLLTQCSRLLCDELSVNFLHFLHTTLKRNRSKIR